MDADNLPQADPPAPEPNAGDPPPPDRRPVRRKLVQSTLLPQKPPEAETSGDLKGDKNSGGDEDAGDEDCTGSQKKKPKRKAKAAPHPRSPKKKAKDKESSDGTPKRNSTPRKKSTPKKNLKADGLNGSCSRKILNEDASPPPIPNLRLEAKITAEENSRMFAGKQLHPFFSSWKVGKKQKDVIDVENCPSTVKKDKKVTIGPIHVFDKNQDDDVSLDWRNWTFCKETSVSTSYDVEDKFISSGFQGLVKSLHLERFPITSQPSSTSYHQNKMCLNECIVQQEHLLETLPTVSALVADELTLNPLIKAKVEPEAGSLSVDDGLVCKLNVEEQRLLEERAKSYRLSCGNNPDDSLWIDKYQPKKAAEVCGNAESVKLLSEWLHCWHQKASLTSKDLTGRVKHNIQDNFDYYQSDTDSENIDEGASLKNILLVTGPAGSGKSAAIYACAKEQGFKVLESNASQWRSGSVLKHEFEECLRSNMINWSMKKSTDSRKNQNLKSSPALPNGIAGQHFDKEVAEVVSISDEEEPQDVTGTSGEFFCKENGTACGQDGTKLLLLIEDVDVLLPEDRGFIASLQHIADAAKGPIVLTSNNSSPLLPDKLDRLEVCFMMPSVKELLHHLYMICVAEKAEVQPQLIEQLIGCCHGDIRKTIMHLQFWCHGQVNGKGRGILTPFCPLVFDLDAGHQILPEIIPWGSPSELSQLVQKEIDKTLAMLEENVSTLREGKVSSKEIQNVLETHDNATDNIEAKKKAMLNRNCYADDCNDIKTGYGVSCEFPSSSGSPVAFSRRKTRRKLDVVMSSDSEEEFIDNSIVIPPNKDTIQELFPEVISGFPSHCPIMENCFKQLADKQHDDEEEKAENLYRVSETADRTLVPNKDTNWELFPEVDHDLSSHWLTMKNCFNPLAGMQRDSNVEKLEKFDQISVIANGTYINNSCKSVDVSCSCVPESSFVQETELDDEKETLSQSVSYFDAAPAEVEVSGELVQNSSQVETESLDKAIPIFHTDSFMLEDNCTEVAESPREDAEEFETEQLEAVGRGYHLMDQCSRMDFNRCTRLVKKPKSSWVPSSVQEAWEKLRSCHTDLRQHASENEDACETLKLAYGMSDLISEVDLLFSGSQLVKNGSLELYDADFDAFGWQDELMQVTSSVAQHGFCVYAKDVAAVRSNINSETLTLSRTSHAATDCGMSPPRRDVASESERKPLLFDAIQSMVPSKSYLALKGTAFHEYVSSLGSISRFETSRVSDGTDQTRKRRRRRGSLHYLTSGRLMLSDEDISLLARCSSYGKRESL